MPTIKENLYFNYNKVSSKIFNVAHVNMENGLFEEQLTANREINETKVKGKEVPLLHDVEETPREFDMTIAFEEAYTEQLIEEVILWLFQDNYKPLFFEERPDRIYYCMPVGDSSIFHNGMNEGYFTIRMKCNSSKIYSPVIESQPYEVADSGNFGLINRGHEVILPEVSIRKIGNGKLVFKNEDGETFEIQNLHDGEDLYINCEKRIIQTDAVGIYRYGDVVGDFDAFQLNRGYNEFAIEGSCEVSFRYTLKYKF